MDKLAHDIIPYGKQHITEDDINSVVSVLRSDILTQGPVIAKFEKEFAKYVGSKFAVAVANGTAALHLCMLGLGLNKGDKVITTPITFAASANCIRYVGGEVIFSDIDATTYLLDLKKVRELLQKVPKGTYKGIIAVDFAGRAVDLQSYRELADEYNMWIVEDSCHAPGGYFKDNMNKIQRCGNGQFADLAIFSFHPVKHIATGEGGMITTNDEKLFKKLLSLRSHGITKNPLEFSNPISLANGGDDNNADYPGWYMEMQALGFNYRLTDFQAALGLSQLERASEGIQRRKKIAKKYADAFNNISSIKGGLGLTEGHAYHLYVVEVEDRLGLYNYLRGQNIYAQVHYIPCHLMPYYKDMGWEKGDFPIAENYYKSCLSIPIFPSMTEKQVNKVINSVKSFFEPSLVSKELKTLN